MFIISPGPRSSGLRAGRGRGVRGDVPACTCVSAEGARSRAVAKSSLVSGRSWMSCLWCSEGTNKHRMTAESCTLTGCTKHIVSARGCHDWTNKNRKPQHSSDLENRKGELCFLSHRGSLCVLLTTSAIKAAAIVYRVCLRTMMDFIWPSNNIEFIVIDRNAVGKILAQFITTDVNSNTNYSLENEQLDLQEQQQKLNIKPSWRLDLFQDCCVRLNYFFLSDQQSQENNLNDKLIIKKIV